VAVNICVNMLLHIHVNMLLYIQMFVNIVVNRNVDKYVNKSISMLANICWFIGKSRYHSSASWLLFYKKGTDGLTDGLSHFITS
jgi:hypothetical protein